MKKQIRFSIFETNSSMMHTLQIMSKEDYDKFMKLEDCDSSFFDEESDYEIQEFTTEHGDVVVAISRVKEDY